MSIQELEGVKGPIGYRNWGKADSGKDLESVKEFILLSDATIDFPMNVRRDFGPYRVFGEMPEISRGDRENRRTRPAAVLQCRLFETNMHEMSEEGTDVSNYFGGAIQEELAALLSLEWGVRLRALPPFRTRMPMQEDGFAQLEGLDWEIWSSQPLEHDLCIPRVTLRKPKDVELIKDYGKMDPPDAVALVRGASLYSKAIWIAENQPHMAWGMLVAAMETVAVHVFESEKADKVDLLKEVFPKANSFLDGLSREKQEECAEIFGRIVGAQNKFRKFWKRYFPKPPADRPESEVAQQAWSRTKMGKVLRQVYQYRSNLLHGGKPFPIPMCEPPDRYSHFFDGDGIPEHPRYAGVSKIATAGGTWEVEDLSLNLHTFEYFVRGTLLNWWQSCAGKDEKGVAT